MFTITLKLLSLYKCTQNKKNATEKVTFLCYVRKN